MHLLQHYQYLCKKDIGMPRAGSKMFRDSLKTQELSLIWVCLLNQCCKIGWHFVNLSYTLHSFYENGLVCSVVFRLCKSGSSQVVWKNLPTCTLYVALIIYSVCCSTEDRCLLAVLFENSWEDHRQPLVLLEENCSGAWAEDLNKALCGSEHYKV